jgi:hypothetical protein
VLGDTEDLGPGWRRLLRLGAAEPEVVEDLPDRYRMGHEDDVAVTLASTSSTRPLWFRLCRVKSVYLDHAHVWAEAYDCDLREVGHVVRDVATKVSNIASAPVRAI